MRIYSIETEKLSKENENPEIYEICNDPILSQPKNVSAMYKDSQARLVHTTKAVNVKFPWDIDLLTQSRLGYRKCKYIAIGNLLLKNEFQRYRYSLQHL